VANACVRKTLNLKVALFRCLFCFARVAQVFRPTHELEKVVTASALPSSECPGYFGNYRRFSAIKIPDHTFRLSIKPLLVARAACGPPGMVYGCAGRNPRTSIANNRRGSTGLIIDEAIIMARRSWNRQGLTIPKDLTTFVPLVPTAHPDQVARAIFEFHANSRPCTRLVGLRPLFSPLLLFFSPMFIATPQAPGFPAKT